MQKWENKIVFFETHLSPPSGILLAMSHAVKKFLDEHGIEGWELVGTQITHDGMLVALKKPVENDNKIEPSPN